MTTIPINDVRNSLVSPSLFNIQYPNCGRGMFSLREPFKDMPTEIIPTEQRELSTRRSTPATIQPTYLNTERVLSKEVKPVEPVPRQASKRNAEIQCSLLTPNTRHDMAVQTKIDRQQTAIHYVNDDNDIIPQYHRQKKLQPIEQNQNIYELWEVESPPLQLIPINETIKHQEPRARHVRNRKPLIDYDNEEEEEFDYNEERIIYARQPRKTIKKTYLPPNVRMICVRDDANRVSY